MFLRKKKACHRLRNVFTGSPHMLTDSSDSYISLSEHITINKETIYYHVQDPEIKECHTEFLNNIQKYPYTVYMYD
jgi:hypothetical protein